QALSCGVNFHQAECFAIRIQRLKHSTRLGASQKKGSLICPKAVSLESGRSRKPTEVFFARTLRKPWREICLPKQCFGSNQKNISSSCTSTMRSCVKFLSVLDQSKSLKLSPHRFPHGLPDSRLLPK